AKIASLRSIMVDDVPAHVFPGRHSGNGPEYPLERGVGIEARLQRDAGNCKSLVLWSEQSWLHLADAVIIDKIDEAAALILVQRHGNPLGGDSRGSGQ